MGEPHRGGSRVSRDDNKVRDCWVSTEGDWKEAIVRRIICAVRRGNRCGRIWRPRHGGQVGIVLR